jgi:hypothetical protein
MQVCIQGQLQQRGLVEVNQCFEGTYCLNLHGQRVNQESNQQAQPKC